MANYIVEKFSSIESVACPCGQSKRAFAALKDGLATFHLVEISKNSRKHYHKKMTEIYFVLEGSGQLELDNDVIDLEPQTCVMIQPGCRHRAKGKLKLINVAIPAFDEEDEYFDEV
jgi:mannose-6-phosphate isomerase-like protein (cupin superfamily)